MVTGAGSGLGRETALGLAALGHDTFVTDLDAAHARTVAEEAIARGGRGP